MPQIKEIRDKLVVSGNALTSCVGWTVILVAHIKASPYLPEPTGTGTRGQLSMELCNNLNFWKAFPPAER